MQGINLDRPSRYWKTMYDRGAVGDAAEVQLTTAELPEWWTIFFYVKILHLARHLSLFLLRATPLLKPWRNHYVST